MVAAKRGKERSESGASAVEFALVFPILALLLFGIISYGYMFTVRQAVTQAAAEGARAAAVAPAGTSESDAIAAVDESLSSFGLKCAPGGPLKCAAVRSTTSPSDDCKSTAGGSSMCVTVTVDYDTFDPFRLPLIPMPSKLSFTSHAEIN